MSVTEPLRHKYVALLAHVAEVGDAGVAPVLWGQPLTPERRNDDDAPRRRGIRP